MEYSSDVGEVIARDGSGRARTPRAQIAVDRWLRGALCRRARARVSRPLGPLYGVSATFLATLAVVNVLYSAFGLTLGPLARRPAWLLSALIGANWSWAAVCVVLALRAPASMTIWGYGHLLGEGAFVAALGYLEWRYRASILALPG